jgi:hypothetical protein
MFALDRTPADKVAENMNLMFLSNVCKLIAKAPAPCPVAF